MSPRFATRGVRRVAPIHRSQTAVAVPTPARIRVKHQLIGFAADYGLPGLRQGCQPALDGRMSHHRMKRGGARNGRNGVASTAGLTPLSTVTVNVLGSDIPNLTGM